MGNIYVYSGYSLTRDTVALPAGDTVTIGGCHYIDLDKKFDPHSVLRSVFFHKGQPYRKEDHDLTLNRLMNIGVFKFVNIRFDETDSAGVPQLDASIYLTPQMMKTIRVELQGVSKSNNFAGPAFNSSFTNKNLFMGGELFKLSLDAEFETSFSGKQAGSSYQAGIRTDLQLPQFITPFGIVDVTSKFVPKTRFSFGFRMLDRLQYYQMMTADGEFGWTWHESPLKEHVLNPFAITFAHLTKKTEAFVALLRANPLLQKSYEEQFIIGENYSFTYNDQLDETKVDHLFFKGNADFSGNILSAAQSLLGGRKATPEAPHTILGKVYSQYSKFDIDARYYLSLSNQSMLAGRFIAGAGFAYGNSSTLPYVKQFTIAGSNSVRAFDARTLGPGSYKVPDSLAGSAFNDQAGDVKLEANLDYRFPIYSIVHGALFLDAGNIWLVHADTARPGSRFSPGTFMDEIAVGTGFGIRFDLSFFVIRFDLAWPLRIPSHPSGQRWVIDTIHFGDPDWRKNNLVLNIAIGYPF
jgi:outer membrane protein assembly factor BamA